MNVNAVQIILIFVVTFIAAVDQFNLSESFYQPMVTGCVVGFILGDIQTGLVVGGTYQLMAIGNIPIILANTIDKEITAFQINESVSVLCQSRLADSLVANNNHRYTPQSTWQKHVSKSPASSRSFSIAIISMVSIPALPAPRTSSLAALNLSSPSAFLIPSYK